MTQFLYLRDPKFLYRGDEANLNKILETFGLKEIVAYQYISDRRALAVAFGIVREVAASRTRRLWWRAKRAARR